MRQYGFLSRLPRYVDKGEGLTVLPSCEVCSTKMCPNGELPSDSQQTDGHRQTPRYAKSPSRSSSSLRVLRRQGAAKHKLARRQATKLCYRFGPLTPFCALREPDRSDGTKNGFPALNKQPTTNQKLLLDRKSPIQVRIRFPPAVSRRTSVLRRRLVPISYSIELRLEWPIVKNGGSRWCLYLDLRSNALPLWAAI